MRARGTIREVKRVAVVIEPEAKADIRAARDYYLDKGDQTSERFSDELFTHWIYCRDIPIPLLLHLVVPVSSQCVTSRTSLDISI
jgi:hypothetical protein